MNIKNIFFLALIFGLAFTSCGEDQDEIVKENPSYIPKIEVQASVFGVVTNMDKESVADAIVTFDGKTTTTDAHGVFRFENENMYQDGTYITIKKDGYFQGSRRFYPREGKESRVGIELMPLTIIDQIESTAASKVKFEDVELDFLANSIVTESGASYTGTVNIAARYLDPTQNSTFNQMPGDLSGFTSEEEVVSLISLGMIGVELMDDNGNELQLKEGSPVSVNIPIPSELLDNAPSTIPLWHFDEEMGIWVEEGEAVKVGNHYEGSLPHFSFWNCDYPIELVSISGTVLNGGLPVFGIQIGIYTPLGFAGYGVTGPTGFYNGKIPANEELTLKLYNACGDVIYTVSIGPFSEDIVLDPININDSDEMVNVSGFVASCEGEEVSSITYVVVNVGIIQTIISLEDNDTFNGLTMYCSPSDEIEIYAYDAFNSTSSAISSYTISGDIEVGELTLCEESFMEHFVYKYGNNVIDFFENNNQDSILAYIHEIVISGDEIIFNFRLYDVVSSQKVEASFAYEPGVPLKDASLGVLNEGFTASGQGSSQLIEQDGVEYYIFKGTLDVIEITDETIYNEDYTEVEYSIVLPK